MFDGLEGYPPLDPVARGKIHMTAAPRERFDQIDDFVVCQRR
jgi:hypothetical protein